MGSSAVLRRSAAERLGVLALGATLGMTLALPGAAQAGFCGDDVDGGRVACACGDEVVSDTTLSGLDPVATEACSGDGLLIKVPRDSDGITLNLGGQNISGSGSGVGIRVVHGGLVGSSIIGGGEDAVTLAEISNFRTGIAANGSKALTELSGVYVHDNVGDGVRIQSTGASVTDVVTEKNGRDGLSVLGRGAQVRGVVADDNHGEGVQVRSEGASVSAEARGNEGHGLVVSGRGNRIEDSVTQDNGGAGLVTSGRDVEVGSLDTRGNSKGNVSDRAAAVSGAGQ